MGAIGFPDFRRQSDFDTNPNLRDFNLEVIPSGTLLGPYNVANFARIAGYIACAGAAQRWQFDFYSLGTPGRFVGSRSLSLDPAIAGDAAFSFPTLGRYCLITPVVNGGGNTTVSGSIIGSNRPSVPEISPDSAEIISAFNVAVPAGATVMALPSRLGSGRAKMLISTGVSAGNFTLWYLRSNLVYRPIRSDVVPAGTNLVVDAYLPAATIFVDMNNPTGVPSTNSITLMLDTSA